MPLENETDIGERPESALQSRLDERIRRCDDLTTELSDALRQLFKQERVISQLQAELDDAKSRMLGAETREGVLKIEVWRRSDELRQLVENLQVAQEARLRSKFALERREAELDIERRAVVDLTKSLSKANKVDEAAPKAQPLSPPRSVVSDDGPSKTTKLSVPSAKSQSLSKPEALKTLRWLALSPFKPLMTERARAKAVARQNSAPRLSEEERVKASGLFDPEWYIATYPDVKAAGLDPLYHYLSHGAREGRSPGPAFDAKRYLKRRGDDASPEARRHPLLDYIDQGEARLAKGLSDKMRHQVSLVISTPLFDAGWYRRHNPEAVGDRDDLAIHYIKHGAPNGRAPGPGFSGERYLREHPDVAEGGVNPLVHYAEFGAGEGRAIFPVTEEELDQARFQNESWTTVSANRQGSSPASNDLPEWRVAPEDFAEGDAPVSFGDVIVGRNAPAKALEIINGFWSAYPAPADAFTNYMPVSSEAPGNPLGIADIWFSNDRTLKLRLDAERSGGLRIFQVDPADGTPRLLFDAISPPGKTAIVDVDLLSPFTSLLAVQASLDLEISAAAHLPFPSLLRGGLHHGELLALADAPSLMSAFWELSGKLLAEWRGGTDSSPLSIGRVVLDLADAIGGEPLFNPEMLKWLRDQMKIEVSAEGGTQDVAGEWETVALADIHSTTDSPERPTGSASLQIPGDSIPSLSALVARRVSAREDTPGAFVVADAATLRPIGSVSIPAIEALSKLKTSTGLQWPVLCGAPRDGDSSLEARAPSFPLSIAFREPGFTPLTTMLTPVAEDFPSPLLLGATDLPGITVIVDCRTVADLLGTVRSLSEQSFQPEQIILALSPEVEGADDLSAFAISARRLKTPGSASNRINAAVAESSTPLIMILRAGVILHDKRTLETLAGTVTRTGASSASCTLLTQDHRQADAAGGMSRLLAGLFPSRLDFSTAPHLVFTEVVAPELLRRCTYPVVGNRLGAVLIDRKTWVAVGGLDAKRYPDVNADVDFAVRSADFGPHLCTSLVTALSTIPDIVERTDPLGPHVVTTDILLALLGRVTVVRNFG